MTLVALCKNLIDVVKYKRVMEDKKYGLDLVRLGSIPSAIQVCSCNEVKSK